MFKVGDVVHLKSGGPSMTVTSVNQTSEGIRVWCSWFWNNEAKKEFFPADALELDDDSEVPSGGGFRAPV